MTNEISLAFASVEDRAAAFGQRDRISLRDYICEVEIGAFQQERGVTQRVQSNVVVEVRGIGEAVNDDVDRILSYDTLVAAVDATLAEERLNLLETFAERVAARVLAEPRAARVFVRVEKLDRGPFRLGVEILREPGKANLPAVALETPVPRVALISNAALADARLPSWLDQLEAAGLPLLLTVERGQTPSPHSPARPAQRRIELLAIEQNAWVLAGRDPRCLVVDSRTEIDFAAQSGHTVVWAPSKMVLDAAQTPLQVDAPGLAVWLAGQLGAEPPLALGLSGAGLNALELSDKLALG